MKNNILRREGQVSLGLIAIIVGALVVTVGGVTLYQHSKPAAKPAPETASAPQTYEEILAKLQKDSPCGTYDVECPGKQEVTAHEMADKAAADAKAFSEQTTAELNTGGKNAVADQPSCDPATNVDCLLQQQARGMDGVLNSQKDLATQTEGVFSIISDVVNFIPSKISDAIDSAKSLYAKFAAPADQGPLLVPVSKPASEAVNKPLVPVPTKTEPSVSGTTAIPSQPKTTGAELSAVDIIKSINFTTAEENLRMWNTLIAMVTPDAAMNARYTIAELLKDLRVRDLKLISSSDIPSSTSVFPQKMICLKSYSDISPLYSGNCSAPSRVVRFNIAKFPKCWVDFSFNVNTKSEYNKLELGLLPPQILGPAENCEQISAKYAPTTSISQGSAAGHAVANVDINYSFRDISGEGTLYNGTLNAKFDVGTMRALTPAESDVIQNEGNF